ncbi:CotO family spore coat protein [Bacillus sp. AFS015802]|uniref:CotO family spore coat protein n=1 Tax=Bacillus sp. AFS015802 TaxID=2033486 RepID=UPI0015CF75A7|nr:CotO family spore coat protein [Bacillus sp. AFS015802]
MRKEPKAGKKPLLYINQPRLEEVKGNMQVTYRSTKKPQPQPGMKDNHPISAPESSKKEKQEDKYYEEEYSMLQENPVKDTPAQPSPEPAERKAATSAFRKLKPFRDLTIDEKLDYISASIYGKVPFPCEFSNGILSVKGIILEDDGDEITVKSFQGEEVKMRKNELTSIKMIGLQ